MAAAAHPRQQRPVRPRAPAHKHCAHPAARAAAASTAAAAGAAADAQARSAGKLAVAAGSRCDTLQSCFRMAVNVEIGAVRQNNITNSVITNCHTNSKVRALFRVRLNAAMPRIASKTPSDADTDTAATAKPLPSLVDEVQVVLAAIAARLPPALLSSPSVEAWAAPGSRSCGIDWPALPAAVDPAAANMGRSTRLSAKKRANKVVDVAKVDARVGRKRQQVESFYLVLRQVVADTTAARQAADPQQPALAPLHLVDFGSGTGNLLLPLAALFPRCRFTGVDMKPAALLLLQQRAAEAGLTNVQVFEGMIETFQQPFDVALALHACGNATDHVLQLAAAQAVAFVVSPCCVGKLKFSMAGGSSFHSSAFAWTPSMPGDRPTRFSDQQQQQQQQQQASHVQSSMHQEQQQEQQGPTLPQLQHPRSSWLKGLLPQPEHHFRIMARVADIAHAPAEQPLLAATLAERAAVADCCKQFVELDRCAAAAEAGYAAGLFKVLGAETMAKNDLLVGVMPQQQQQQRQLVPGTQAEARAEAVADAACPGSPSRGGSSMSARLCTIDCRLLSQVQA